MDLQYFIDVWELSTFLCPPERLAAKNSLSVTITITTGITGLCGVFLTILLLMGDQVEVWARETVKREFSREMYYGYNENSQA
jgi:hypothetical protein